MWPTKLLDNRPHYVVPTVLAREGVMNGSAGPLFYPGDELKKSAKLWDGRVGVIKHPALHINGGRAGHPAVFENQRVAFLFNVRYRDTDKTLRGELWLDADKLGRVSPSLLAKVKSGQPVEISTGLFTTNEPKAGSYKGTPFYAIARNHQPDHLAIIPDGPGACSCADGCGCGVLNSARRPGLVEAVLQLNQLGSRRIPERIILQAAPEGWLPSTMPVKNQRPSAPAPIAQRQQRGFHGFVSDRPTIVVPAGWMPTTMPPTKNKRSVCSGRASQRSVAL